MQISFSKYYIYISNVDCDTINMISWKKNTNNLWLCDQGGRVTWRQKREKKNDRVKQETLTDSQRETRLYALYLHNGRAQMEPDVIDEFTTETCDRWASNSGGRNVPSGISTRFMSILAGRQEKNKYHGATAEKKKLKNTKDSGGEKKQDWERNRPINVEKEIIQGFSGG